MFVPITSAESCGKKWKTSSHAVVLSWFSFLLNSIAHAWIETFKVTFLTDQQEVLPCFWHQTFWRQLVLAGLAIVPSTSVRDHRKENNKFMALSECMSNCLLCRNGVWWMYLWDKFCNPWTELICSKRGVKVSECQGLLPCDLQYVGWDSGRYTTCAVVSFKSVANLIISLMTSSTAVYREQIQKCNALAF